MKYAVGDMVEHFTGNIGMITGVYQDVNQYKFVYANHNNDPEGLIIEPCEIVGLADVEDDNIGFRKKKERLGSKLNLTSLRQKAADWQRHCCIFWAFLHQRRLSTNLSYNVLHFRTNFYRLLNLLPRFRCNLL